MEVNAEFQPIPVLNIYSDGISQDMGSFDYHKNICQAIRG